MTEKDLKKRKELILKFMKEPGYTPMRKREIGAVFQVPQNAREELELVLEALLADGAVTMDTRGRYHVEEAVVVQGEFRGTSREFGFVTPEDGSADIYIEGGSTLGALNGDIVQIVVFPGEDLRGGKSKVGRVVKIVTRANETVVGTFFKRRTMALLLRRTSVWAVTFLLTESIPWER